MNKDASSDPTQLFGNLHSQSATYPAIHNRLSNVKLSGGQCFCINTRSLKPVRSCVMLGCVGTIHQAEYGDFVVQVQEELVRSIFLIAQADYC